MKKRIIFAITASLTAMFIIGMFIFLMSWMFGINNSLFYNYIKILIVMSIIFFILGLIGYGNEIENKEAHFVAKIKN